MARSKKLPARAQVDPADTWDLSSLFPSDEAWHAAFKKWEQRIAGFSRFRGKLASSPTTLAACLKFDAELDRAGERLGTYAFLRTAEDMGCSETHRMQGLYRHAASEAAQAASFMRPEIMAMSAARIKQFLAAPELAPYRLLIQRVLRYKPHTLFDREEKLLAMQSEMAGAAGQIFRQLNDADLKFGQIKNERGDSIELSHASFAALLDSPSREVRKRAFEQYYAVYAAHENSLAAALSGSVQRDVYYAKARGYPSSLAAALFPDQVPETVYDNLLSSVRRALPALHRYYELRRRKMRLKEIHHYDTYVPILAELKRRHSWKQAVKLVLTALEPLGGEYCGVLEQGLNGRWCDRYENQGKQSGAFSSGSYDGDPYILINYQEDVLDHVFTLAHEAGHSMHSHYSAKHQPFIYYDYTIFVAEVASTFNEQLLGRRLMDQARDDRERAFLVNREIDSIRRTIIRQTMFAEFERVIHEFGDRGEPLTVERLKGSYRELLEAYFGPQFALDGLLELECLRIPHFYRAFYVYKYATGLSAAIALGKRVLEGGPQELKAYLGFLKGGASKYPLELLRDAGVDMERPEPVDTALATFARLVDELDSLL